MTHLLPTHDHNPAMSARAGLAFALTIFLLAAPAAAGSPDTPVPPSSSLVLLSPGRAYIEADGASLYANVCQGCHMRDGRGAVGAATYPSLAGNADLQSKSFALQVVLKGLKGMPPVGRAMTDDQVAAVLDYVRTRFGSVAGDAVTAADAAAVRAAKDD